MVEPQTRNEAGRKGGYRKWAKIEKKERSLIMRKVALARWQKGKSPTT